MKDIFISHSSLDRTVCENICEWLESFGFTCWVSYRPEDLPPGENYPDCIKTAIDSSKIFILLASRNSLATEQVKQEAILANERQKYGLRIISVVIEDGDILNELKYSMGYIFAGKEIASWNQMESQNALLCQIRLILNGENISEKAEIISTIPHCNALIGRENEIRDILQILKKTGKLCISGIGGIGKTAILQHMCTEDFPQYYSKIIYLSVDKCLLRTIENDEKLRLYNEKIAEKKRKCSDYEYGMYKLKLLENSIDDNTLIIVDNLDTDKDPLLDRICSMKCNIIVATRYRQFYKQGFQNYTVREIKNKASINELFEKYYGSQINSSESEIIYKLLKSTNFHTITVILLAKQMHYFGKKPSDYKNNAQLRFERNRNLDQIIESNNFDTSVTKMYLQLFELFDVDSFSKEELAIMKTLCILPSEGIYRHLYIEIMGEKITDHITSLEKMGWVYSENDSSMIVLHPLIRDVVMHELNVHIDDPDIKYFFEKFSEMISKAWDSAYTENIKYKNLAISFCYQFPNPTKEQYKKYLILSKYLWTVNCLDLSIEIQNKIKQLFIDKNGNHLNTSDEAETFMQIGLTYHLKADYQNASRELEKARKIFINRYAASLTHLAQAYMEADSKPFEEIEPMYKESLEIRQKYWPNTISEAASCHMYAKALSHYQLNLEYAIKLEKRAYKLFNTIQPGTKNVSSAAYILGWLFIQTADDNDDILFGIKKLLEAKQIRAQSVDSLHPWFEDIYLKLGLAYMKINDFTEARNYFELLLEVRERKYSGLADNTPIVNSYKLLNTVYEKLDDEEGIKRCKKYLKYYAD